MINNLGWYGAPSGSFILVPQLTLQDLQIHRNHRAGTFGNHLAENKSFLVPFGPMRRRRLMTMDVFRKSYSRRVNRLMAFVHTFWHSHLTENVVSLLLCLL